LEQVTQQSTPSLSGGARTSKPARWLALLAGLLLATFSFQGCGQQRNVKNELAKLDQASKQLSFSQAARDGVHLFLDSSASMRGFALAAVRNERVPAGSWVSIFVGIDALSRHIRLSRFGGSVQAHAGPVALFPLVVGSQRVAPIGQAGLDPSWRSRACNGRPFSGGGVTDAIDTLFSERETCLGLALDQASKEASDSVLRIVLTDSEQAAGDESAGCPLGNNPTPVQDRLYDWVHTRRQFGAIVLLRLPYEGWRVVAPTHDYCRCANRNVFLYLLGPSANAVEKAYAQIKERWQGEASDIAYLPLAPRPAAQYLLRMTVPKTAAGDVPAVIGGGTDRTESDQLPILFLQLKEDEAVVRFTLSKAAFHSAAIRVAAAGSAALPVAGDLAWGDQAVLVEITPPGKDAKSPSLRLTRGAGAVEFVRLPEPTKEDLAREAKRGPQVRDTQFFSGGYKIAEAGMTSLQLTGSWEVRRRQGAKRGASELYLFELYAHGGRLVDRLIAATPLLQAQDRACSGLDNITAQLRHVYQETPVARFLLHIDS
jgi:hypothetical protein